MSIFSKTADLNAVSKLISKIYRSDLSKVRHKIALESGYQNDNAHVAAIRKSECKERNANVGAFADTQLPLDEMLDASTLLGKTKFDWFPTSLMDANDFCIYEVTAPFVIKLLLEGYDLKSTSTLLTKVFWLEGELITDEEGGSLERVTLNFTFYEPELYNELMGAESCYLATLKQRINPWNIVEDIDLLKGVPELAKELLVSGSLPQYNFFANNPELVQTLGLEKELALRYFTLLRLLSGDERWETSDHEIPHLSNDMVWKRESNPLSLLDTPPPAWFTKSVWDEFSFYEKGSFEDEVLSYFLGLYDGLEMPRTRPWIITSKESAGRNFSYSPEQEAFLHHSQFFADVAASDLLNGGELLDGKQELITLMYLLTERPIDLTSEPVARLLSETLTLKDRIYPMGVAVHWNGFVFKRESSFDSGKNETEWFDMTFLAQVIVSQTTRVVSLYRHEDSLDKRMGFMALLRDLFSRLSKEQLEVKVDLPSIGYEDAYSFGEETTVKGWLKAALKMMSVQEPSSKE